MAKLPRPVALITGASSGIGAALAEQLAGEGNDLIIVGRDAGRLDAVARRCRALGADCSVAAMDICDRDAFARLVTETERNRPIALFVSNAGILDGRREGEAVEGAESAHMVLDTNLLAAVDALHVVLPGMRARKSGRVLLVASLAAFAPLVDAPAYSASKSGLLAYGLALREAVGPEGIVVTVACPGYVATRMAKVHIGNRPGELSAERAAAKILAALRKRKALHGFPVNLYWSARLSPFIHVRLRRFVTDGLRFHVRQD